MCVCEHCGCAAGSQWICYYVLLVSCSLKLHTDDRRSDGGFWFFFFFLIIISIWLSCSSANKTDMKRSPSKRHHATMCLSAHVGSEWWWAGAEKCPLARFLLLSQGDKESLEVIGHSIIMSLGRREWSSQQRGNVTGLDTLNSKVTLELTPRQAEWREGQCCWTTGTIPIRSLSPSAGLYETLHNMFSDQNMTFPWVSAVWFWDFDNSLSANILTCGCVYFLFIYLLSSCRAHH